MNNTSILVIYAMYDLCDNYAEQQSLHDNDSFVNK